MITEKSKHKLPAASCLIATIVFLINANAVTVSEMRTKIRNMVIQHLCWSVQFYSTFGGRSRRTRRSPWKVCASLENMFPKFFPKYQKMKLLKNELYYCNKALTVLAIFESHWLIAPNNSNWNFSSNESMPVFELSTVVPPIVAQVAVPVILVPTIFAAIAATVPAEIVGEERYFCVSIRLLA